MNIKKDFKNKLNTKDYLKYLLGRNLILDLSPLIIISFIALLIISIVTKGWTWEIALYLLPIVLFIITYFQLYRLLKYTLKSQKEIYQLEITLTDNEYKDITNGEENSLEYSKAYCYKETKNYFYLHVNKDNALIIPKREFDDKEIDQIRETFSKKMKKVNLITFSSLVAPILFILLIGLIVASLLV